MSVVLDLSYTVCVWISAAVAITYTLLGGFYSVAYTDVIQLSMMFLGLVSFCYFKFSFWCLTCSRRSFQNLIGFMHKSYVCLPFKL